MIPGFITLYKDNKNNIHLYFYKGLRDDDGFYYNDLNLLAIENAGYTYKIINYNDQAKEIVFDNKNIKSMTCKLISYDGNIENKILKIR
jgi:hypothetical protein